MRQLVLLRGPMGAGKSTWVKENGLEEYTLSPDVIRNLYSSPVFNIENKKSINNSNETLVWKTLTEMLEHRMANGEFTIVDATHVKQSALGKYKELCQRYRYRCYAIEFDLPLEQVLKQNASRDEHKIVPELVVKNAQTRMQTEYLPKWIKVLKPDTALEELAWKKADFNEYEKIFVIGDIHNSYTQLEELFHVINYGIKELNDKHAYIFCGDYFDRGSQPYLTFEFLDKIRTKKNVILLEGNHERHLPDYAFGCNDGKVKSNTFERTTLTPLLDWGVTQSQIREFTRSLQQIVYFTYRGEDYLVTHGGVTSRIGSLAGKAKGINLVSTKQLINGIGEYSDNIDKEFSENIDRELIQIHGHRNQYSVEINQYPRSINLENSVERGGTLRAIALDDDGIDYIEIKNKYYKPDVYHEPVQNLTASEFYEFAKSHDYIKMNRVPHNTVSLNFTKAAFKKSHWDNISIKARGLFLNVDENRIVARGYDKFFNIGENTRMSPTEIKKKIEFPVTVYKKYNGFLGLVSYDKTTGGLRFFTKSQSSEVSENHAKWFETLFKNTLSVLAQEMISDYSEMDNVTFVFEVIDLDNDPHIIDYPNNHLVLLDIISNSIDFEKASYYRLVQLALQLDLRVKKREHQFNTWFEFWEWYNTVIKDESIREEGYVVEDSNGFMCKVKLPYYTKWKNIRSMVSKFTDKKWHLVDTRRLYDSELNEFANWCKTNKTEEELRGENIIKLREEFYQRENNKG
ncbi:TPA: RNA ligase [Streptococcus suis]